MARATFPEKSDNTPESHLTAAMETSTALNQAILEHRGTTHPSSRLTNGAAMIFRSAHGLHQLGSNTTRVAMRLYEGLDNAQKAVKIFHYPQDFDGNDELQPIAFMLHARLSPPPVLHQHLTALKLHLSNYTQSVGL
jgi:hypothetical protein